VKEGISCKEVDSLGVIDFEFVLDDHDEFEDGESFDDQNSKSNMKYLLLSKSLSLLFLILLRKIGILSGWNLRIISAS